VHRILGVGVAVGFLVVFGAAGCAVRGLSATLGGDDPEAGIPWSAERLRWSDFQGAPPPGIPNLALTVYRWAVSVRCVGTEFTFSVESRFMPRSSWVARPLLASPMTSRRALQHEQTHFDLAEVHARRLRQFFADLPAACERPTDELEALAQPFLADDNREQERYDSETRNGRDELRQIAWDRDVERRLAALRGYAN